ncbi:carboxypeptidase-like regulatory domain-containing protein [Chondrinema litorale]|uniref:carboxypeptidase-like regulatory domain-containing protein n=1 Tax=Chondrinema litorale TaxID=2994555 RepID=UPI002542CCA3|nr:carboxypeptidase-like regulatory domain-containing protein [Chondrinema litorale]UZR96602.1 carboxypeptidase-like regulatory domain-containing protein [Chondrinema litorale]
MKKQISLDIPKPCGEKWSTFTPTATGGFCASCQKNVIDFTKMTDDEIQQFFLKKPQHACGRFHPDQLKTYSTKPVPTNKFGWKLLKAGFISLSLLFLSKKESLAQSNSKIEVVEYDEKNKTQQSEDSKNTFTVKGIVKIEDENEPLPGASIVLFGTDKGTIADLDGYFELENIKTGDVLQFSYIGCETQLYTVSVADSSITLNIDLKYEWSDGDMCIVIAGEVSVNEVYSEKSFFAKLGGKIKQIFK